MREILLDVIIKLIGGDYMLTTPLGKIEIYIDDKIVTYSVQSLGVMEKLCQNITGRFCIEINYEPDGGQHTISCRIKDYTPSQEDGIESGERLELKSFYKGQTKLSIGMEGEAGYFYDGTRASDTYDYDNEYLDDGVQYVIMKDTKTSVYKFGVAWIDNVNDENDIQTWFGADPTIL